MFPNLIEATNDYWRELNKLEAAYKKGEVSLEEVDARVSQLMAELAEERRATLRFLISNLDRVWREQREIVVGVGLLGILTYTWVVMS